MGYQANPALTHRFTGKERDTETGLDFSIARYYSAAMGRFNSADLPFIDQDLSNPQSWNLYSYVRNSPLTLVDPDGRCSVKEPGGPATDDPGKPCTTGSNQSITVEDLIVAVEGVAIVGNELMRRQGESLAETLLDGLQWLARPRDLGCLTKNTAAGAGGGLVVGAAWGLAGGPGGVATVPGGAVLGFGGGGFAGWSGGMVSCQVGTPNNGGGGGDGAKQSASKQEAKRSTAGNMQKQVERGQAPKSVKRVDVARVAHEKDQVHFNDGHALNYDGTWKHGGRSLTNTEKEWLASNGWAVPE